MGKLLVEMKERGERHDGRGNPQTLKNHRELHAATLDTPTLTDLGIEKTRAARGLLPFLKQILTPTMNLTACKSDYRQ